MQDLNKWKQASKTAALCLKYGESLIIKGASFLEVTQKVEEKIRELGAEPAFPVQMSLNEVAAHFTVDPGEDIIFSDQLVNIDVGVHIDGCIGDNALTVDLSGNYTDLVKASREALDNAIKIMKPGTTLGQIGTIIQDTIQSYGFSPVKNLSGHGLSLYNIHSKPSIPNFNTGDDTALQSGMIIASEPFASNGAGMIYESSPANIYAMIYKKPVRSPMARKILKEIEKLKNLPFTTRWLAEKLGIATTKFGIRELLQYGIIKEYPPLLDKNKGMVSQAEHTILITDDGCEVLTKI